jgi:hypothetical protein
LSLLGLVKMHQFRLCYVKFGYSGIIYLMLLGIVIFGHPSLTLTSLSLLYRFVNVLYIWTPFLTGEHVLSRLVTPSNALSRIILYSRFWPVYRFYDSCWFNLSQTEFLTLDKPQNIFSLGVNPTKHEGEDSSQPSSHVKRVWSFAISLCMPSRHETDGQGHICKDSNDARRPHAHSFIRDKSSRNSVHSQATGSTVKLYSWLSSYPAPRINPVAMENSGGGGGTETLHIRNRILKMKNMQLSWLQFLQTAPVVWLYQNVRSMPSTQLYDLWDFRFSWQRVWRWDPSGI